MTRFMPTKVPADLKRRLAAIMAVDVVGSSRLMEVDEASTLSAIRSILTKVLKPAAARHGGRIVKLLGDGALLEFPSPVLAEGALDRLLGRAHQLVLQGHSYRPLQRPDRARLPGAEVAPFDPDRGQA